MRNEDNNVQFEDDAIPIKRRPKSASKSAPTAKPAEGRPAPVRRAAAQKAEQPKTAQKAEQPKTAQKAERPQTAQKAERPQTAQRAGRPQTARRAPVNSSVRVIPTAKRADDENIKLNKKKEETPGKKKVFGKVFLIYVGVLFIAAAIFLIYVHGLLVDFEASQVENVIAAKLKDVKVAASLGNLEKEMSLDGIIEKYSPTSDELSDYQKAFSSGELTYKKTRAPIGSETDQYLIYLNGFRIGTIDVKTVKEGTVLAIFPVTEWEIVSCEADTFSFDFPSSVTLTSNGETLTGRPSQTEGLVSYTISSLFSGDTVVTDSVGNTAPFNGKDQVSFTSVTVKTLSTYGVYSGDKLIDPSMAKTEPIEDYVYIKEYCSEVPDIATYHLCLIDNGTELTVKDASGAVVEYDKDSSVIDATAIKTEDTLPAGLSGSPDPLEMAHTWSLIMSDDLGTNMHGFNLITPYLIKDSYFYNVVWDWVTSIDITFMSGHYLQNPPFVNESVTEYVKFSDNCFSCRIKFDKPMHLDNGNDYTDKINSVFYFVYIDDTPEDGLNNPHWAIADRR